MSLRMRILCPFAVAVAAMSTGCLLFPSSGQEDDTRSGFHDVTVSWRLRNVDGSLMTACPPGFTTLYGYLYHDYGVYAPPPDAEVKLPCAPQGSFTRPVATGGLLKDTGPDSRGGYFNYSPEKDIVLVVTEETLRSEAAVTSPYYVKALTSDLSLSFDIYPAGGVGVLAWQLRSSLTSALLASCAAAGVDQVEAAVRPFSDDTAPYVVVGTWGCQDSDPYQYYEPNGNGFPLIDEELEFGSGTTRALAMNDYRVRLRAKRGGAVVGTLESQLRINGKNDANPIHPATIIIDDR